MSAKMCYVKLDAVDYTDKRFQHDIHAMHVNIEHVEAGKGGGGSDIITLVGPCAALRRVIKLYWDNDPECLVQIMPLPEGE